MSRKVFVDEFPWMYFVRYRSKQRTLSLMRSLLLAVISYCSFGHGHDEMHVCRWRSDVEVLSVGRLFSAQRLLMLSKGRREAYFTGSALDICPFDYTIFVH